MSVFSGEEVDWKLGAEEGINQNDPSPEVVDLRESFFPNLNMYIDKVTPPNHCPASVNKTVLDNSINADALNQNADKKKELKIMSWNVGGNPFLKVQSLLTSEFPDIACFQETKISIKQMNNHIYWWQNNFTDMQDQPIYDYYYNVPSMEELRKFSTLQSLIQEEEPATRYPARCGLLIAIKRESGLKVIKLKRCKCRRELILEFEDFIINNIYAPVRPKEWVFKRSMIPNGQAHHYHKMEESMAINKKKYFEDHLLKLFIQEDKPVITIGDANMHESSDHKLSGTKLSKEEKWWLSKRQLHNITDVTVSEKENGNYTRVQGDKMTNPDVVYIQQEFKHLISEVKIDQLWQHNFQNISNSSDHLPISIQLQIDEKGVEAMKDHKLKPHHYKVALNMMSKNEEVINLIQQNTQLLEEEDITTDELTQSLQQMYTVIMEQATFVKKEEDQRKGIPDYGKVKMNCCNKKLRKYKSLRDTFCHYNNSIQNALDSKQRLDPKFTGFNYRDVEVKIEELKREYAFVPMKIIVDENDRPEWNRLMSLTTQAIAHIQHLREEQIKELNNKIQATELQQMIELGMGEKTIYKKMISRLNQKGSRTFNHLNTTRRKLKTFKEEDKLEKDLETNRVFWEATHTEKVSEEDRGPEINNDWNKTIPKLDKDQQLMAEQILLKEIDLEELNEAQKELGKNKSPKPNNIPNDFYRELAMNTDEEEEVVLIKEQFNLYILQLFKLLLNGHEHPKQWAVCVNVLLKKDTTIKKDEPSNFRPIALLDSLYKLWTAIMTKRLREVYETNGLLSPHQYGSRKKRSTTVPIYGLIADLSRANNEQEPMAILFLDLVKAYNKVPRFGIRRSLQNRNIPEKFIKMVMNCYQDTRATVMYKGKQSKEYMEETCVRQGDPLAPLLFIIFMDPLLWWLNKRTHHSSLPESTDLDVETDAFVDDLKFVMSSLEDTITVAGRLEKYLNYYGFEAGVKENASKTALMINNHMEDELKKRKKKFKVTIQERDIPVLSGTQSYKYLGLRINAALNWDAEYEATIKKIDKKLLLLKMQALTGTQVKWVVNMMVIPVARYRFMHVMFTKTQVERMDQRIRSAVRSSLRCGQLHDAAIHGTKDSDMALGIVSCQDEQQARYIHTFLNVINADHRPSRKVEELIKLNYTKVTIPRDQFAIRNLRKDLDISKHTKLVQIKWLLTATYNTDTRVYRSAINTFKEQAVEYTDTPSERIKTIENWTMYEGIDEEYEGLVGRIGKQVNSKVYIKHITARASNLNVMRIRQIADKRKKYCDKHQMQIWKRNDKLTTAVWVDGSAKDGIASWSCYFKHNSQLNENKIAIGPADSNFAELNATLRALQNTVCKIEQDNEDIQLIQDIQHIIIFQDNLEAVKLVNNRNWIQQCKSSHDRFRNTIIKVLQQLEIQNITVESIHVPSHQENKSEDLINEWQQRMEALFPEKEGTAAEWIKEGNVKADKMAEEAITNTFPPTADQKRDFMLGAPKYQIVSRDLIAYGMAVDVATGEMTPFELPDLMERSMENNIAATLLYSLSEQRTSEYQYKQREDNRIPFRGHHQVNWKNSQPQQVRNIQQLQRFKNTMQFRTNSFKTARKQGTILRQAQMDFNNKKKLSEKLKKQRKERREKDPRIGKHHINAIPLSQMQHTPDSKRTSEKIDNPYQTLVREEHKKLSEFVELRFDHEYLELIKWRDEARITKKVCREEIKKLAKKGRSRKGHQERYKRHRNFFCPNCFESGREDVIENVIHMLIRCPSTAKTHRSLLQEMQIMLHKHTDGEVNHNQLWEGEQKEPLIHPNLDEEQKLICTLYYYEPIQLQRVANKYDKEDKKSLREKYYEIVDRAIKRIMRTREISISLNAAANPLTICRGKIMLPMKLKHGQTLAQEKFLGQEIEPEPPPNSGEQVVIGDYYPTYDWQTWPD
jgi:hypothetical protein